MEWTDEPATWKQVKYLKEHGFEPDHPLTKSEATTLIRQLGQTQSATLLAETSPAAVGHGCRAADLHEAVERTREDPTAGDLQDAVNRRQEFWLDTCREPTQFRIGSAQIRDLNIKYGCLFATPSPRQVQDVLDAYGWGLELSRSELGGLKVTIAPRSEVPEQPSPSAKQSRL